MDKERCYLCCWAYKLVEHPENSYRKYTFKCKLDHQEHEPCSACEFFQEQINNKEIRNGRTYSLEENN